MRKQELHKPQSKFLQKHITSLKLFLSFSFFVECYHMQISQYLRSCMFTVRRHFEIMLYRIVTASPESRAVSTNVTNQIARNVSHLKIYTNTN